MSPYITYPLFILAKQYPILILVLLMYELYTMAQNEQHPIRKAHICTKLISLIRKRCL